MKLKFLSFGLLAISSALPFMPSFTHPASASLGCGMVDVNTQIAIRGTHDPAQQSNTVGMYDDGSCFGGFVTNTGTQVYTGYEAPTQNRNSLEYVGGDPSMNPTGINTPTIRVPVNVQMDMYSPAHDPNFIPNYGTDIYSGNIPNPAYGY